MTVTYAARGTSTLSRQGVTVLTWFLTTLTRSSTPRSDLRTMLFASLSALMRSSSVGIPCTVTYLRLTCWSNHRCSRICFPAKSPRKMTASMMRKIHVPAYEPVLRGAQADEYNGVLLEPKNTISIRDIDMRVALDIDDDIEELE